MRGNRTTRPSGIGFDAPVSGTVTVADSLHPDWPIIPGSAAKNNTPAPATRAGTRTVLSAHARSTTAPASRWSTESSKLTGDPAGTSPGRSATDASPGDDFRTPVILG